MAGPAEILVGGLAGAHEIAQRLVSLVGHPNGRQLPAAQEAGELERVPAVRLDAIAGAHRHEGRSDHGAVDAHRGELAIEYVAARARLIADAEVGQRAELAHQLGDGVGIVGNGAEAAGRLLTLGDGHGDRGLVDIESHPDVPVHRPAPFACSSALRVGASDPQRNLRDAANRSRSFHCD